MKQNPIPMFRAVRVRRQADVPLAEERIVDVVVLDMNHDWPNLGHDSLVKAVGEIAADFEPLLADAGLAVRVLSYDVRAALMVPEHPGERFAVYLGTGGPGHVDPRRNDGVSPGTQGIREDPAWEAPLFRLFDAIHDSEETALLAVCHTFGVLCRWADVAEPVLRGPEKGGKSSGVRSNVLTNEARRHPWFTRLSAELEDGRHLRIVDSRLYDLIPRSGSLPVGMAAIGFESSPDAGPGDALTMLELARDRRGMMPRMFAVNHHPEIRELRAQRVLLDRKLERGEVPLEWYEERARTLHELEDPEIAGEVALTSRYTLLTPLRFHLYRALRRRLERLGFRGPMDEQQVVESIPVLADPDAGLPG